ncbi:alpha/beta hydrolase [candidate division KSB1 bacterium]|nr:alpha/beta hydrolase [candidate division KSB1 bacterium]
MTHKFRYSKNNSTNVRLSIKRSITFVSVSLLSFIAPSVIRRFILKQFFIPIRYIPTENEQEYLVKAEQFEQVVIDEKIKCWKWGKGPSILFAHGWNGSGIQFSSFITDVVNSGFSLVAFDGPGHGQSEGNRSSYFQMTNSVRALMKSDKLARVAGTIGHSFGAGAIVNALSKENLPVPSVLIAPALRIKEVLDDTFTQYGIPLQLYYNIIAEYERKYGYSLADDNPTNLLPKLNNPVLIIHDTEDRVIPVSDSIQAESMYDYIELHQTKGLGHKRILADQNVIESAIQFIRENSKRS